MGHGQHLDRAVAGESVILVGDRQRLGEPADPRDPEHIGGLEEHRRDRVERPARRLRHQMDVRRGGECREHRQTVGEIGRHAERLEPRRGLAQHLAEAGREHVVEHPGQGRDGGAIGRDHRGDPVGEGDVPQEPRRAHDEQVLHQPVEGELLHPRDAVVERIDRRVERRQAVGVADRDIGAGDVERRRARPFADP